MERLSSSRSGIYGIASRRHPVNWQHAGGLSTRSTRRRLSISHRVVHFSPGEAQGNFVLAERTPPVLGLVRRKGVPLPESDPGHSIPRRSRRASALMAFASLAELWIHPIRTIRRARSGPVRPTFNDLRRMDPERLAAWHQETGIEDRVRRDG